MTHAMCVALTQRASPDFPRASRLPADDPLGTSDRPDPHADPQSFRPGALRDGLSIIGEALDVADRYYAG